MPIALLSTLGPPGIPSFAGSEGLSGNYVSAEGVLGILGLLAWGLWAYLAFAVMLNIVAELAAIRRMHAGRALFAASVLLTPRVVRRLVEVAIGGVVVACSVSGNLELSAKVKGPYIGTASEQAAISSRSEVPAPDASKNDTYRVQPGDSLWRIAERELGSGFRWLEIYRLNRDRTFGDGRRFTNPHLIHPDWVLEVPPADKGGLLQKEDMARDEVAESAPGDANGQEVGNSLVPTTPVQVGQQVSLGEGSRQTDVEEDEIERPTKPLFNLRSGLTVAATFASGMLAAHLLGTLRRRWEHRPLISEPDGSSETPLVTDLRRAGATAMASRIDVALDAVSQAWRATRETLPRVLEAVEGEGRVAILIQDGDDGPLPPRSGGSVSPLIRFSKEEGFVLGEVTGPFPPMLRPAGTPMHRGLVVPLGRTADGAATHAGLLAGGPVGIEGGRAADLARQMILAAAATGPPEDLEVTLLAPPSDLEHLDRLPHVTGSYAWDRSSAFLREVQAEFIRRARLFLEEGIEDVWEHLAQHPDERLPLLLLIVGEPPSVLRGLIEALAQAAPRLGMSLVGIGWQPPAASLTVEVESVAALRTNLPGGRNLHPFLLTHEAAEEAIDILAWAHPPDRQMEPSGTGGELGEPPHERPEEPVSLPDAMPASVYEQAQPAAEEPAPNRNVHALRTTGDAQLEGGPHGWGKSPPRKAATGVVSVRCLGPLGISRDGRSFRKGWRAKSRELIAFLVANPSGAPRDRIIEELWPETDPRQGSDLFYVATSTIRRRLRVGDDSRRYVSRDGEVFRLQRGEWWVDVWEFERLAKEAEFADEERAIDGLRDAVSLYRGEFCADSYYPWAEATREHLRAVFVRASARLAELLSRGEAHQEALAEALQEAVAVLDRAIDADPVCEDLCRRAMLIDVSLGRRGAALARYRRLETTLSRDLGVEPDPETQGLARQLQRQRNETGGIS